MQVGEILLAGWLCLADREAGNRVSASKLMQAKLGNGALAGTASAGYHLIQFQILEERYRSGHNGAASKADGCHSHVGSNPTLSGFFSRE